MADFPYDPPITAQIETEEILQEIESFLSAVAQRTLFSHAKGYSMQEIAQEEQVAVGTVKTRIHRARNIIRDKFNA